MQSCLSERYQSVALLEMEPYQKAGRTGNLKKKGNHPDDSITKNQTEYCGECWSLQKIYCYMMSTENHCYEKVKTDPEKCRKINQFNIRLFQPCHYQGWKSHILGIMQTALVWQF